MPQTLKDNLRQIHVSNENRKYVSNWQETLPPGSLWSPGSKGDPACKTCRGTGWVRADVYPGHPQFGKLMFCDCVQEAMHRNLAFENSSDYHPSAK